MQKADWDPDLGPVVGADLGTGHRRIRAVDDEAMLRHLPGRLEGATQGQRAPPVERSNSHEELAA